MNKSYRLVYMLSSNSEEKVVDEFKQKLETELNNLGGKTISSKQNKNYMVKTSENKGARGSFVIDSIIELSAKNVKELDRYLKLAQGMVVNYMILVAPKALVKA